jgi:hypothetical protein
MGRVLLAGLASGVLFAVLDGIINANPLAQRLYAVYRPVARASVNAVAGVAIDIAYGIVMAAVYVTLRPALPGSGMVKGLAFGIIVWFFRVVMGAVGQWMILAVPGTTVAYSLVAGGVDMLILGALYGATLRK